MPGLLVLSGCAVLPELAHEPTLHNPFPELSKVAIAPFFNLSDEPTLDGRQFALAYFNELQLVPGFEVVPIGVVEQAIRETGNRLASPEDARRLAQHLQVDAIVIGAVTDYSPYYPPRCAMQVEWYAANPGYHPIPPGYGLPWGTPEEQQIPGRLVFQAEMALAKEQMKTQTPQCGDAPSMDGQGEASQGGAGRSGQTRLRPIPSPENSPKDYPVKPASHELAASGRGIGPSGISGMPANWPDPRGFIPQAPSPVPPPCRPQFGPVMRHTRAYNGQDREFTEALSNYYYFRDDARFGGWQSYLQRSDDFIRFCCHMHIWEMLSARGGAGQTRVVWRWPRIR
ncbi:MAG: hypothetical protein ACUVUC_12245 [Thermoguttaceae bacterium]